MIAWWWLLPGAGAGAVLGVVLGQFVARTGIAREEAREAQRRTLERQRITHDTKRVSVARPGTTPGRVSKASIDMRASNMQQHGREVD